MTPEEKKQYNELRKEVNKANQRIAKIEKAYGKGSWAIKKLYSYLEADYIQAITNTGRISLKQSYSDIQLRAIRKATNQFLKSKTSTLSGIKTQIKKIKAGIKENIDVTDKEAEILYETFNEDLLRWIFQYIEPSDFWALLMEAKDYNYSYDRFENGVLSLSSDLVDLINTINDLDTKEKLQEIYDRYVK